MYVVCVRIGWKRAEQKLLKAETEIKTTKTTQNKIQLPMIRCGCTYIADRFQGLLPELVLKLSD